jgi:ATP-dependent helicase HrpB
VVDSGFERSVSFQAQSGIGKLQQQRISEASATQRAGRAGRTSAGVCYRLWSKESKLTKQSTPEIDRSDLTSLLLEVLNWGATDVSQLPFISTPPEKNILSAQKQLKQFTAIDKNNRLTSHGEAICTLGVTPRLGHLLLKSLQLEKQLKITGLMNLACLLVAVLENNERGTDDLVEVILKSRHLPHIKKQQQKLQQKLKQSQSQPQSNSRLPLDYVGLLLAFAYPDRIAQCRSQQDGEYLLSNGVGATLFQHSSLIGKKMLVVADLGLSDRMVNSLIYKAVEVDLKQLQAEIPHYFQTDAIIFWQLSTKRLIAEKQLRLGKLVISKKPILTLTNDQKVQAIVTGLQKSGLSVLNWRDEDKQLLTRLRYAQTTLKEQEKSSSTDFPDFSEEALLENIEEWLSPYLINVTKPEQLKRIRLSEALLACLDWSALQRFNKDFPTHIKVPTGSNIKITYRENEIPVLSVKMQALFGQTTTPAIYQGRIPLQLALLSPAGRPLQLTQDLIAFWSGAYDQVKKEMKGRYPKHYWPDNPLTAQATNKTKKNM